MTGDLTERCPPPEVAYDPDRCKICYPRAHPLGYVTRPEGVHWWAPHTDRDRPDDSGPYPWLVAS